MEHEASHSVSELLDKAFRAYPTVELAAEAILRGASTPYSDTQECAKRRLDLHSYYRSTALKRTAQEPFFHTWTVVLSGPTLHEAITSACRTEAAGFVGGSGAQPEEPVRDLRVAPSHR